MKYYNKLSSLLLAALVAVSSFSLQSCKDQPDEFKLSDGTPTIHYIRPAKASASDSLLVQAYPQATICCILNSELRESVNESMREVCAHYQVKLVELHDIEKQNGHPSINGMKSICQQLLEAGL